MLQMLVVSNFAKDRENIRRELCLNVIIPFYIIVDCLETTRYSEMYSEYNEMGNAYFRKKNCKKAF